MVRNLLEPKGLPMSKRTCEYNSYCQRYRLEFFVDGMEIKLETTGDKLIESLGKIADSVRMVTIVDMNALDCLAYDGFFFYWINMPHIKKFSHMVDTEIFPASKAASDWWNAHIGKPVTI